MIEMKKSSLLDTEQREIYPTISGYISDVLDKYANVFFDKEDKAWEKYHAYLKRETPNGEFSRVDFSTNDIALLWDIVDEKMANEWFARILPGYTLKYSKEEFGGFNVRADGVVEIYYTGDSIYHAHTGYMLGVALLAERYLLMYPAKEEEIDLVLLVARMAGYDPDEQWDVWNYVTGNYHCDSYEMATNLYVEFGQEIMDDFVFNSISSDSIHKVNLIVDRMNRIMNDLNDIVDTYEAE